MEEEGGESLADVLRDARTHAVGIKAAAHAAKLVLRGARPRLDDPAAAAVDGVGELVARAGGARVCAAALERCCWRQRTLREAEVRPSAPSAVAADAAALLDVAAVGLGESVAADVMRASASIVRSTNPATTQPLLEALVLAAAPFFPAADANGNVPEERGGWSVRSFERQS